MTWTLPIAVRRHLSMLVGPHVANPRHPANEDPGHIPTGGLSRQDRGPEPEMRCAKRPHAALGLIPMATFHHPDIRGATVEKPG
jgi:hypothetical protein